MPAIIDVNAEAAKLTMFRGRTPQTTFAARKGSAAQLGPYRDGFLLLSKSAGTGHWETHPADELLYVLEGSMTVDILEADGPKSFALGVGMLAVVPQGAWHRVHSADGVTVMSATIPGEHIDLDVADPRAVERQPASGVAPGRKQPSSNAREMAGRTLSIIDLNAEVANLTMFRRTPRASVADRKGSVARLGSYRDGVLFAIKSSGTDHWESHLTGDELVYVLDGSATLDIVDEAGPPRSFALHAGMLAVVPQGAWHRIRSPEGVTQMSATPFPGEHIELDVDDPRTVERQAVKV